MALQHGTIIGGVIAVATVAGIAVAARGKEDSPLAFSPDAVRQALRNNCGNVVAAARELGIAEKTVHAVMNRHPQLRREATAMRRRTSRTGHGRPPRSVACPRRSP